jgi:predicted TIM-barrel fold metal-dependent hydrolase
MTHPVISADGHIDLPCLPETLFSENAPAHLKSRVPRVQEANGERFWVNEAGTRLGLVGGMGSAGRRYQPGQIHRADRMAETGLYADQARGVMRTTIPELRIKDQDRDGVVGEVIYGILGAANRVNDAEVAGAMVRIYNDFASEFAKSFPDRFAMIGCLPIGSPAAAADEVRRCAGLGLRGVELPVTDDLMPLWRREWDPLWQAAEECALPVHLHTVGGKTDLRWVQEREHYLPWLASHITCFQMWMASHLTAIVFGGALERFPRVRVVIGESGLGWIPYVLERMDYEWEDQFRNLELRMRPSEYWQRQMYATFQQDATGLHLLERLGVDNVMWGSDFPHPDGLWPDSREFLDRMLAPLADETRRRLTYDTAAEVYGFPRRER